MRFIPYHWFFLALIPLSPCGAQAASDFFLSDYVALPEGTTALQTYFVHRDHGERYVNGDKSAPSGGIDTNIIALRASHFLQAGNITVAPFVLVAGAQSESAPTLFSRTYGYKTSGFADLRFGSTVWLINNTDQQEYLGISAVATAPNGEYQPRQIINAGENRWKFSLNGGWIKPLGKNLVLGLSPEVTWYGTNKQYAGRTLTGNSILEQAPSYSLTGVLAYQIIPDFWVYVDGQTNQGGSQKLDHVEQHNPANNNRVMLGTAYGSPHSQLWSLRYGRDISIENGFRMNNEVILRYSIAFE